MTTAFTLLLMRHGKSDRGAGYREDFSRPLAKRGLRSVPRIAEWMRAKNLLPDLVLASPAERTRQTCDLVVTTTGTDSGNIIHDDRLYLAGSDELLEIIRERAGKHCTVMLIGHNPGLENLLLYLADGRITIPPDGKLMPTAALAWMEADMSPQNIGRHSMKLVELVRPRDLET